MQIGSTENFTTCFLFKSVEKPQSLLPLLPQQALLSVKGELKPFVLGVQPPDQSHYSTS